MLFVLLQDKLCPYIIKKSKKTYYPFILCFVIAGLSILLAFAPTINTDANSLTWRVIMLKANDLTNSLTFLPKDSGLSKKVFRLTVPIFIRIFHLTPLLVLLLQYLIGYGTLVFAYKLALRVTNNVVSATLLVFGMAFIYFGRAAFVDVVSIWFDGWAFFFLVLSLYSTNPLLLFIFASFAAWTDERAFIALPIAIIFHQIIDQKQEYGLKTLIQLNSRTLSVMAAMMGYLVVRFVLSKYFDMHTPISEGTGVSFKEIINNITFIPFGIWTFLEGFWIILLGGFLLAFLRKDYFLFVCILLQLGISTIVACCVYDITRSGSYIFPILFVLLAYIHQIDDNEEVIKKLIFQAASISFIFPAYYVILHILFYKSIIFTTIQKFL